MKYREIGARCLFCQAIVEGNQEYLYGQWLTSKDLAPMRIVCEDRTGRNALMNGTGTLDSDYQDFYLCPEHNDPDHYHAAMDWAEEQFQKGVFIDFSDISTAPLLSPQVKKWDDSDPPLSEQVPEVSDEDAHLNLPNSWQSRDPRLGGCLEISYALVDTWDAAISPFLADRLKLDSFPKPLELAEAMKKAASAIECRTRKEP
jgi:hypothetical protein